MKRNSILYFDKPANFDKIVNNISTIYFKKIKSDDMARLLVLSEAKKEKEEAMDTLKEARFLEDIDKLKASVSRGSVMLLSKIQIRIGRLMAKYLTVAKYYDIGTETAIQTS